MVHSGYVLPLHSDWGACFPVRVSVSVGVPRDHRTRTPDNSGRSHDHSLIGVADRSFALRRNDSFAVITNHSRHGPLVVSQLRFSGPAPLNAVASMGQPTQLPLWASLLMPASRASSLCSIFLLVLRNWHYQRTQGNTNTQYSRQTTALHSHRPLASGCRAADAACSCNAVWCGIARLYFSHWKPIFDLMA